MSITTYLSARSREELDLSDYQDHLHSVTVRAVNHASDYVPDAPSSERFVSKCGHKIGWPDDKLTELPPECVEAGCTLGFSVVRFKGMVVEERERNMHDDSDFFATWYDKDTDTHGEVMTGSTRGWTYFNGSSIDADEETMAAWLANRERAAESGRKWRAEKEAAAEAKIPSKGKRVRVTSKRSKVPHGTEGVVFWFGESSYASPYRHKYRNPYAGLVSTKSEMLLGDRRHYRIGIKTDEGQKHFCAATWVESLEQVGA